MKNIKRFAKTTNNSLLVGDSDNYNVHCSAYFYTRQWNVEISVRKLWTEKENDHSKEVMIFFALPSTRIDKRFCLKNNNELAHLCSKLLQHFCAFIKISILPIWKYYAFMKNNTKPHNPEWMK